MYRGQHAHTRPDPNQTFKLITASTETDLNIYYDLLVGETSLGLETRIQTYNKKTIMTYYNE